MNYNPMKLFGGDGVNAAEFQIMEEEAARRNSINNAISFFVSLHNDDVDINDEAVQKRVLKYYGLEDISDSELSEIASRVTKLIN